MKPKKLLASFLGLALLFNLTLPANAGLSLGGGGGTDLDLIMQYGDNLKFTAESNSGSLLKEKLKKQLEKTFKKYGIESGYINIPALGGLQVQVVQTGGVVTQTTTTDPLLIMRSKWFLTEGQKAEFMKMSNVELGKIIFNTTDETLNKIKTWTTTATDFNLYTVANAFALDPVSTNNFFEKSNPDLIKYNNNGTIAINSLDLINFGKFYSTNDYNTIYDNPDTTLSGLTTANIKVGPFVVAGKDLGQEDSSKRRSNGIYNNQYLWSWGGLDENGDSKISYGEGPCGTGWHIPTLREYQQMCQAIGGSAADCTTVDSWRTGTVTGGTYGGITVENGTSIRDAMMQVYKLGYQGYRNTDGSYYYQGTYGYYWSATESSATNARNLYLGTTSGLLWNNNTKAYGFSVRCLKDYKNQSDYFDSSDSSKYLAFASKTNKEKSGCSEEIFVNTSSGTKILCKYDSMLNNTDWYYNGTYKHSLFNGSFVPLTTWDNAMGTGSTASGSFIEKSCTTGYHVPTLAEYGLLCQAIGGSAADCTTVDSWRTGTVTGGTYGGTTVAAGTSIRDAMMQVYKLGYQGIRSTDGSYYYQGANGNYWSATETSATNARNLGLGSTDGLYWSNGTKALGFSVRCLKD